MIKNLMFVLLLTSCTRNIPHHIAPEFAMHVATFEMVTGHPVNLDIEFGPLPADIAGTCYKPNSGRYILINKTWWDYSVDSSHEQVIFHELGHCIYNMGHDSNRIILDGVSAPESIMYPETFGYESYYIHHRDYYFSQFMHSIPNPP